MFAILALVCFLLELIKVQLGDVSLTVLGLFFLSLHFIVEAWPFTNLRLARRK